MTKTTVVPATDASVREYDTLVKQYRDSMEGGDSPYGWHSVWDARKPGTKTATVERKFRKPVTTEAPYQLQTTATMRNAYILLRNRRKTVARLTLPVGHPLPGQVDASFLRFCDLAEAVASRGIDSIHARKLPEHVQAVELASQVAALVDLAERREAVVSHADPESLRRSAQALIEDLNTARAFLDTDPIDRELTAAAGSV